MTSSPSEDDPARFFRSRPEHVATPLLELPSLARKAGVSALLVKDESRRWLGSFKSLGGTYAGLRALTRAAGAAGIQQLLEVRGPRPLPRLVCASDGNHGLAVAAGARIAGTTARIYLHRHVPATRARLIAELGADIAWVDGTYDDAVDAARLAARQGDGLLISDTSDDPADPVVADVMAGYGMCAREIVDQVRQADLPAPTHVFIQAGVGGLAAALAAGLAAFHCRLVVVEPESVACVGAALRSGRIERLDGDLRTSAEMLSCGEASAPALRILHQWNAAWTTATEQALATAPGVLADHGGPATTPSGAAGLAGLLSLSDPVRFGVDETSRVLLVATEGLHGTEQPCSD